MWTCITCLWLLNNLKAIELKTYWFICHIRAICFRLILLLNPKDSFQVSSCAELVKWQTVGTNCCYLCCFDLCGAFKRKMCALN